MRYPEAHRGLEEVWIHANFATFWWIAKVGSVKKIGDCCKNKMFKTDVYSSLLYKVLYRQVLVVFLTIGCTYKHLEGIGPLRNKFDQTPSVRLTSWMFYWHLSTTLEGVVTSKQEWAHEKYAVVQRQLCKGCLGAVRVTSILQGKIDSKRSNQALITKIKIGLPIILEGY